MKDRDRVFFHELGHFIARELNHKYYGGPDTLQIIINPYQDSRKLFVGDTKIKVSADGKEKMAPSKETPAVGSVQ